MDHHPSSQAPEIPLIFHDEASHWRVFVSANGINGRPKLVRTLKKAGAVICSDPKQANVILVDATSDTGKEFIREWGNDTDKVVLQHTWVDACIAASKALGKDDEWGGFLTIDDGLPIAKEGTEATENQVNLLPTPRITPLEGPPPAPAQLVPTPAPEAPHGTHILPQNTITNSSPNDYPHAYMMLMMQQQAYMSQMQQHHHQQALFTGNPMSPFAFPSGPSGLLTSYSAAMPQLSQGLTSVDPNPYHHSNQNISFLQDTSAVPSEQPDLQSISGTIPPSFRRKPPILARSTHTSHASDDHMRSISPANASPSASSSLPPAPQTASLSSTLFQSKTFFVQIGLFDRTLTVNAIKRHGGKITSEFKTADYAIFYSREKPNDQLYEAIVAAKRPIVTAAFVHDCIDQNSLLDTTSYKFSARNDKTPTRGAKRKRFKSEDEDDNSMSAEAKRLERNRRQKERREQAQEKQAKAEALTSKKMANMEISAAQPDYPLRPRSPTPPPEHTRQRRGANQGYIYSDREREYAEDYMKMDHHSLASWKTFTSQEPFRTILEGARKTAGIAFRKRQAKEELLAKEINIVAQFFASGGGRQNPDDEDEENDEVLWDRLTQQVGATIANVPKLAGIVQ
ncbi:hypothetical protein C0991_000230 [Blastosporella zonata]|nr:hypothetical protein C0991_000230 [Blastosporella zonata]